MAINGLDINVNKGATKVADTIEQVVDTAAIADRVREEVDAEIGSSPTYKYEFDTEDPIQIAKAIKLELLDGLTRAIFDNDISKLDFALYVARTELAKNPKHYVRLAFIDGMGYKYIMLNPTEENILKLKEDFKLVAESTDPTELGANFDLDYLKQLANELTTPVIEKEEKEESTIIGDAKASMDEAAKEHEKVTEETTNTVKDDVKNNNISTSSSSNKSSSSFWDSDVVSVVATVVAIGAVAYAAYKVYDHFADDGDIIIIDDDIGAFDMGY